MRYSRASPDSPSFRGCDVKNVASSQRSADSSGETSIRGSGLPLLRFTIGFSCGPSTRIGAVIPARL